MAEPDHALTDIRTELRHRTGLRVRDRDLDQLGELALERARSLGLGGLGRYLDRLRAGDQDADEEWRQLVSRWTNNESFFFRDDGQVALLRNWLIPELIDRRRTTRRLSVWSAGCSTGEEVYTLAVLLHEAVPPGWEISVVGTDIDRDALRAARQAVYTGNAFRRTPAEIRDRYFEPYGDGSRPIEPIRSVTSFLSHNLVRDRMPAEVEPCDLILCRNVFIYFEREAVQRTIERFISGMRQGAFLLTGHTELLGLDLDGLSARVLPESVIYERVPPGESPTEPAEPSSTKRSPHSTGSAPEPTRSRAAARPEPQAAPSDEPEAPASEARSTAEDEQTVLERARAQLAEGRPKEALSELEETLDGSASNEARLLAARGRANLGEAERARQLAEQTIEDDPFEAEAHRLLAQLAMEAGDRDDAREHLERVLYLDDTDAEAYLELAWVYEDEARPERAAKMRETALALLEGADPDQRLPAYPGSTVGEIVDHLHAIVEGPGSEPGDDG